MAKGINSIAIYFHLLNFIIMKLFLNLSGFSNCS